MKVLITCGPSFEPIDEVRRITNFSTGRLGIQLSSFFSLSGVEVICVLGSLSTVRPQNPPFKLYSFDTNEGLWNTVKGLAQEHSFQAVFHAAALCDFQVKEIVDQEGKETVKAKIATDREYWMRLVPARKLLENFREVFPKALLTGWKYEVSGNYETVYKKGKQQIERSGSDYCVLNGPAYGQGYGILNKQGEVFHANSVEDIGAFFIDKIVASS
ncbi:phosphopantothenoylcysteine synthase [Methylacidiphilum kamchatkense Kam1]|uniref:DNA/pantothenate metabolism flavoprotein n=1 Tax=Methylacidiphilum kamchatkense Kam1 TaxID=1202785 RepID=A0A0C1USI8_9BACT|nr:phosphopantothenoylcysteine decarboxylase [Methylacidiphilum kamchatkense]KIE59244.1 phosphopantothenoylcysteine synthase [Methylacidiphilum kamchatkense Kam1]QDQ42795.1 DNA/pantothenate metabolism flavoprotein [Methylacidiphilum kamchatkense Kam1]